MTQPAVFVQSNFEANPDVVAYLEGWLSTNQIQVILRGSFRECIETATKAVGGPYSHDELLSAFQALGLWPRSAGCDAFVIVFDPAYEKDYPLGWYK